MEAPHRLSTYNELAEGRVVADPFIRTADASALVPLYVRRSCRARALRGPRPDPRPDSAADTYLEIEYRGTRDPSFKRCQRETERC